MAQEKLNWQSKLVLLAVLPYVSIDVVFALLRLPAESTPMVVWTIGLSGLLGIVTWKVRAATPAAALTGTVITADLMLSTTVSAEPWHTALTPILAVSMIAFAATRVGRQMKEQLGTAEKRRGRSASQVAANLGIAALVTCIPVQIWLIDSGFVRGTLVPLPVFTLGLAALAEAAADTVSSEIGQVLGGRPWMITSFRAVEPGRDGAVSVAGTLSGIAAAAAVAGAGTWALRGDWNLFWISTAGGVFGLFFDSLLGATFEAWGWLNNDAVNFLSTASASGFALALLSWYG